MARLDWLELARDASDAWSGLRRRTGRSMLSGLGIGIGVLALVAMLSISEGARREIQQKIASLGTDTVRVESTTPDRDFDSASISNVSPGLTLGDAEFLRRALGARAVLGYYARSDDINLTAGGISDRGSAIGASPNWFADERLSLATGRPLLQSDMAAQSRVCVAGSALAARLRLGIGSVVRVGPAPCEIIGILQSKGQLLTEGTGLASLDFDDAIILPYHSFSQRQSRGGRALIDGIVARANDRRALFEISDTLSGQLQRRHRGVLDYRIVVPLKLLQEARRTQTLFQLVMGSIAGLSLLVGGIGVMNIMLANISEQTREIGLRMAVGAPRRRIVSLYLWHAVLLCLAGGLFGLIGGVLVALLVQQMAAWPVAFSVWSMLFGPFSALGAGVVFGLHPAFVAARLDPVAALHDL